MLRTENATIRFGGLVAVNSVNMHIKEGQITALIGPNGAGKTTTFNMISGFYAPTSGKVIFDGQEIQGKKQSEINRAGIARTYQNINLFNKMVNSKNMECKSHCAQQYIYVAFVDGREAVRNTQQIQTAQCNPNAAPQFQTDFLFQE